MSTYDRAVAACVPKTRRSASRFSRIAVATVCLCAHVALLVMIENDPNLATRAARSFTSTEEDGQAMQVVDLTTADPTTRTDPGEDLAIPEVHLRDIDPERALRAAGMVVDPLGEEGSAGDPQARDREYERYLDRLAERIERAWQRPRTAIGASEFSCQTQITEDASGRVTEVMLEDCNGDSTWQVSLVRAIEASSPMPRPPGSPAVGSRLHLGFTSDQPAER